MRMNMMMMMMINLLFIVLINLINAKTLMLSTLPLEAEEFIECYWCNSRDAYCGKRVTDTMVTTLKCPKTHKCTVYTNPYDNYYLHRGCTIGMDFGDLQIENGCFIEEDGSTYCFCDFNRCNAAGIIDLRNLAATRNEEKENKIVQNEKFYDELAAKKDKTTGSLIQQTTVTVSPVTTTTTSVPTTTTTMATTTTAAATTTTIVKGGVKDSAGFPFQTKYDSSLRNLDDLLADYLKFSKSVNSNNKQQLQQNSEFKIQTGEDYLLKKIQEYSGGVPVGSSAYTINNRLTTTPIVQTKSNGTFKSAESDEPPVAVQKNIVTLQDIKDRLSILKSFKTTTASTPSTTTTTTTTTTTKTTSTSTSTTTRPTTTTTPTTTTPAATTSTPVNKTVEATPGTRTATLIPRKSFEKSTKLLESDYVVDPNTHHIDWVKTYQEKYNYDNVLDFKCPNDGLYKHPTNCNQFLQCVYFGSIYERYYVLDCPSGLFFNQKYSICDYSFNVVC